MNTLNCYRTYCKLRVQNIGLSFVSNGSLKFQFLSNFDSYVDMLHVNPYVDTLHVDLYVDLYVNTLHVDPYVDMLHVDTYVGTLHDLSLYY